MPNRLLAALAGLLALFSFAAPAQAYWEDGHETVARIAEADVPAGAKFVNCASCKSRVPLPQKMAVPKSVSIPTIPKAASSD